MWKKLCLIGLVAFVTFKLSDIIPVLGFHKTVYNHYPGPCKSIPNIANGSEDMELIPNDKVLITTGLKFMEHSNKNFADIVTGVYLYDFNKPSSGVRPVPINNFRELKDCDFHGISSWIDEKTGSTLVFIVNHLEDESVIEIFSYDNVNNVLDHRETVGKGDPNVRLLNDVVAVGPRHFYATNYLHSRSKLEIPLMLNWGSVVYFDGTKTSLVSSGHSQPNGISRSPDGKYIYVAPILGRELITFQRNADGTLTTRERTHLYTSPDNLFVDPDNGDIYTGCHPVIHMTGEYIENPKQMLSPSQVLRLRMRDGKVTQISEILLDDGKVISGSSIAVYRKNQLLVGTVATNMLQCDVKHMS